MQNNIIMIKYNLPFVLLLASCIFLINVALEIEDIVGGNLAFQPNHKYQVAIFGKYNKSQARYLLCAGGIISDFFILSSAQCFLGVHQELRRVRFYIIVGLITLTIDDTLTKEILYIYLQGQNLIRSRDNLAVVELAESLNLHNSTLLKSLDLPDRRQLFEGRQGIIAGHGLTSVSIVKGSTARSRNLINETSKQNLTYAFVDIVSSENCILESYWLNPEKDMCGIIRPNYKHRHRGICTFDEGAPLEIDNTVIGIAYGGSIDCNDTVIGAIYTQVLPSIDFVRGIISRDFPAGTVVHPNRIHKR